MNKIRQVSDILVKAGFFKDREDIWLLQRGEIRDDVDIEMIASMLDWLMERFQDALGSEELDPGLVHRKPYTPERRESRIREFLELLRSRIAASGA